MEGWDNWAENLQKQYALMGANATENNPATLSGSGWGGQSHTELNAGWQPFTDQKIASFFEQNKSNPQAIVDAANQYGIGYDRILGATGYNAQQGQDYLNWAGITQGPNGFQIGQPAPQPTQPTQSTPGLGGMAGLGGSPSWPSQGTQFGGGFSGTGMQVPVASDPTGGGAMGSNPYRSDVLGYLKNDMLDFTNRALSGVRSNAVGVGGLGGSRQGIAEANVINNAAKNYGSTAAGMLSGDYQFDRNLNTQSYNANRGMDLTQMGLGAQLIGQANQMPWLGLQNASNIYGQYSGLGNNDSGNNWQQILGGLVSGAGLEGKMGLWS